MVYSRYLVIVTLLISYMHGSIELSWNKGVELGQEIEDKAILEHFKKKSPSFYIHYKKKIDKINKTIKNETVLIGGVMWQDNLESKNKIININDAKKYCKNLKIGYYDDWYIPTLKQLQSLHKSKSKLRHLSDWFYWSNKKVQNKNGMYGVNFKEYKDNSWSDSSYTQYIRCVRSIKK
ncbi:MAG: DUF1566 domain-containing protein [Bacteroidota bacterium]|nr:DUF1566 domain-containing protein [Bacteroidota bacterium]